MIRRIAHLCLPIALTAGALATAESNPKLDALSRGIVEEYRRGGTLTESGPLVEYLSATAKQILGNSAPSLKSVVVINTGTNAADTPIALPDGTLIVPKPRVAKVESEEELRAMLAHSLGHSKEGLVECKNPAVTGSGSPVIVYIPDRDNRLAPRGCRQAAATSERDADISAVAALSASGHDPRALLRYLQRRGIPQPRLEFLEEYLENMPSVQLVPDTEQFKQMHKLASAPGPKVPTLRK